MGYDSGNAYEPIDPSQHNEAVSTVTLTSVLVTQKPWKQLCTCHECEGCPDDRFSCDDEILSCLGGGCYSTDSSDASVFSTAIIRTLAHMRANDLGDCAAVRSKKSDIRRRDQERKKGEPVGFHWLTGVKSRETSQLLPPFHTTSADMIIRLGRLTPGYFRLLQRQVAGEVQTQPQDRAVNQIAMMLAIMGLGLSYYSAKQMTEKVHAQPAP
ncbi:hypothetical protein PAMP_002790 [Pampus punctatissimus]